MMNLKLSPKELKILMAVLTKFKDEGYFWDSDNEGNIELPLSDMGEDFVTFDENEIDQIIEKVTEKI